MRKCERVRNELHEQVKRHCYMVRAHDTENIIVCYVMKDYCLPDDAIPERFKGVSVRVVRLERLKMSA